MDLIYAIPLSFYALSAFVNLVTSLLLAVFIYLKNPGSGVSKTFSFFLLMVSLWSFFLYLLFISGSAAMSEFYLRTCMVGVIFMPSTFTHFIYHFLGLRRRDLKIVLFNYGLSVALACTVYSGLFAREFGPFLVFPVWGKADLLLTAHITQFVLSAIFTHSAMLMAIRRRSGQFRNQIRYVFAGVTIGFLAGGTNYFPWYSMPVPPFPNILVSLGVATIAYGIVRHRLMDIRIAAVRTLVFTLVYLPILSIPYIVGHFFGVSWVLPTLMQTIFAPGGLFVYIKIQERAELKVLRGEYRNAGEIRQLARGIIRFDDVGQLSKVVVESLGKITGAEKAALYVISRDRSGYALSSSFGDISMPGEIDINDSAVSFFEKERSPILLSEISGDRGRTIRTLFDNRIVVAIPIAEDESFLGIIFLGEKPDARIYGQIELAAFEILARQLAFSIQLIQFIGEKEEMQRAINEVQRMKEFRYLASSIGHEVGNGIQSIADVISTFFVNPVLASRFRDDRELQEVMMEVYGDISDNISNLKLVTRSLRNYIREEEPGEIVDVELGDLVERVIVLLNVRNRGMKGMKVGVEGDAVIKGNPGALQAVFYNLLNNSYDAIIERENSDKDRDPGYAGNIKVLIFEGNGFTEVRVRDNGIGMDDEVRSRIFTPLFTTKSHEVTKDSRMRGGTGIGMETIKKMVEGHGGRIEVSWSKEGEGAEFLLLFPSDMEV